mmetsp:Transcript_64079/g.138728  ORF Transcript_64079/g.138728 Transcript_64079/m.138728 type:complete len:97 (+) Transcript_64079:157-447(+)|eukprot:CAMPEP_0116944010 /NCGR_PEP_ID=MMETSP0467-20121206/35537_1 /TAXON_ID=283647 /ORGANISM="Mesodinium pulex, Strain SPMC105" /LENGTH=96 /DNA_ID=CAMNT_0004627319 /DNA_START=158 /DNA_END=448 /DNA_ORIENTATION=-
MNDDNKKDVPLILWLNGGPGASSLGGLLTENIGAMVFNADGTELVKNQFAWTKFANVLAVDNPVGVGFSATKNEYVKSEGEMAEQFQLFFEHFFKL